MEISWFALCIFWYCFIGIAYSELGTWAIGVTQGRQLLAWERIILFIFAIPLIMMTIFFMIHGKDKY